MDDDREHITDDDGAISTYAERLLLAAFNDDYDSWAATYAEIANCTGCLGSVLLSVCDYAVIMASFVNGEPSASQRAYHESWLQGRLRIRLDRSTPKGAP